PDLPSFPTRRSSDLQVSDFVCCPNFYPVIEPAARNLLSRFSQRDHWARNQFGEKQCEPGGGKKHENSEQQQQPHVSPAQQFALPAKFEISLLAGFQLLYRLRKLLRQRHGDQNHAVLADRS